MKWAYYNEIDQFNCEWLKILIKKKLLIDGEIDNRSIEDVAPKDVEKFQQCHFFAGIGGWAEALRQADWPQGVRVWTGSCPCQPFSQAGKKAGVNDERHLWPAFHWLIDQSQPEFIFGEQVASKDGKEWLDLVSTDLENSLYEVGAIIAPACGFGAPHVRSRIYWSASHYSNSQRNAGIFKSKSIGRKKTAWNEFDRKDLQSIYESPRKPNRRWPKPIICWLDDGLQTRVGRLRGFGNAIVVPQAQAFVSAFMEIAQEKEYSPSASSKVTNSSAAS